MFFNLKRYTYYEINSTVRSRIVLPSNVQVNEFWEGRCSIKDLAK